MRGRRDVGVMTIRQSMNQWLHGNVSVFHQIEPPLCQRFSNDTVKEMLDIAEDSADVALEKGAPIYDDYTLGKIVTGTSYSVAVPRPSRTMGTFHTHPFGSPFPSGKDVVEMIDSEDKILCIGRGGYRMTRVGCFTQPRDRDWMQMGIEIERAGMEVSAFNEEMREKHPGKVGFALRSYLNEHDTANWYRMIDLKDKEDRLGRKASKLTYPERPFVPDCSWDRPVEKWIRGISPGAP